MIMDIKDFLFGERFTNEDFALFSKTELSEIEVLSEKEASNIWYDYCDDEILPKSSFAVKTGLGKLPLIMNDCGWGEENEENDIFSSIHVQKEAFPKMKRESAAIQKNCCVYLLLNCFFLTPFLLITQFPDQLFTIFYVAMTLPAQTSIY